MKVPKGHRVQAQRKFAQGAYVPSQLVPVTRSTQEVKKDRLEPKDVIQNKTSAKNLLDLVSFERHHRHDELYVVVRRLEDTGSCYGVEDKNHRNPKTNTTQKVNKVKGLPIRIDNANKCRKNKEPPSLNMNLRSHTSVRKRVSHVAQGIKRKMSPAKDSLKSRRLLRNSRESDDSIPLCYMKMKMEMARLKSSRVNGSTSSRSIQSIKKKTLKKSKNGKTKKLPKGTLTRESTKNKIKKNKSKNTYNIGPGVKKGISTLADMLSGIKKRRAATLKSNRQMDIDDSTTVSSFPGRPCHKIVNVDVMVHAPSDLNLSDMTSGKATNSNHSQIGDYQNINTEQIHLVPRQSQRVSKAYKGKSLVRGGKNPIVKLTNVSSKQIADSSRDSICSAINAYSSVFSAHSDVIEPQPGPSGLNKHSAAHNRVRSDISSLSDEIQPLISVASGTTARGLYYNKNQIRNWLDDNNESPGDDDSESVACPAREWVTLKDVVDAFKQDVSRRCNNCRQCNRVTKLFRLSSLLKKQRSIECTDEELEHDRPAEPSNVCDDRSDISSSVDDRYLYLELLPSHPHLMIKLQIQHLHGRQMVSARLIPRSDAKMSEELLLVEHEYIVDQLTNMLTMNLQHRAPSVVAVVGTGLDCAESIVNEMDDDYTVIIPPLPDVVPEVQAEADADADADANTEVLVHTPMQTRRMRQSSAESNATNLTRTTFPKSVECAQQVDAPVFLPTREEFKNPIEYFEKIAPYASKFGLCKVIPPPKFTPKCNINDDIHFDPAHQYISRLYSRWGPAAREMCAIKACLEGANLEGIDLNMPKLYHAVQRCGGLEKVIYKKHWGRVADDMRLPRTPNPERKLEQIYMKYLLPYDTLAHKERQEILRKVEKWWNRRHQKLMDRALNPLHRQKRLLGESDSSDDETDEDRQMESVMKEAEDCILPGSSISLGKFKKVAATSLDNFFRNPTRPPTPAEVEHEYWRHVLMGTEHICVNTASIDTGEEGYGFSQTRPEPYYNHPWNIKMFSQNSGNVLRSLGPVLGLTVPMLHVGMVFSTSCWHRDPHGLPWIEYMHEGPRKIWYGIPDEQSRKFRTAVETLCPSSCQNKSIWLPSDITMIPPNLLLEHNVSLSRVEQQAGEFVIVFPKAYSCSICTGYTISESIYFATNSWLNCVHEVFQELRDSCEPTMFSLDQLLISIAQDQRTPLSVLQQVHANLSSIVTDEIDYRALIIDKDIPVVFVRNGEHTKKKRRSGAWNIEECEICRMSLYLSKVTGLTGRNSSVCVQHGVRLLNTPANLKLRVEGVQLWTYVTTEGLSQLLKQAQARLSGQKRRG